MSDDLVKRLRKRAEFTGPYSPLWDEAADRIEALEAALRKVARITEEELTHITVMTALVGEKKDDT